MSGRPTSTKEAFGTQLRLYEPFFSPSDYISFKSSIMRDIYFVSEGKSNARLTAVTKRLYAVYGNEGTGVSYK